MGLRPRAGEARAWSSATNYKRYKNLKLFVQSQTQARKGDECREKKEELFHILDTFFPRG